MCVWSDGRWIGRELWRERERERERRGKEDKMSASFTLMLYLHVL